MKVAFLIPSNVAGGAERVLTSLSNQFANDKIDTWFIQFDKYTNFYDISNDVHRVSLEIEPGKRRGIKKWTMLPTYLRSLKKVLQQIKPDVVISFLFITNVVGSICCKKLGIPIILSERNDPNEYSRKCKIVMKFLYPHAKGFVCQSLIVKDYIQRHYGIKNATVIVNPLNSSQVGEIKTEKKDSIIAVGRLIPQKNFELLIDAFAEIASEFQTYTLSIFGDGPLRDELNDRIKKYGLSDRIILPGITRNILKNNNAKIFVLSSKFEGYPNVLAEAMANGIICIASDVPSGTVRQLISHGENGYIFPVGDKEALINLLKYVMGSDNTFSDLTNNAIKIYRDTSIEKIAYQWEQYIYSTNE